MRTLGLAISILFLACGCGSPVDNGASVPAQEPEAYSASPAPNTFRITDVVRNPDGSARYVAAANSVDSECQFEILVGAINPADGSPFSFTSASLSRRTGSDCSGFLSALAPTLGFGGAIPAPAPVSRLDASIVVLGVNLSRIPGNAEFAGEFTSNPSGTWLATKLFLADGEGEVFLNLDPKNGSGDFSLKDEGYATIVVTELAKVLLPIDPGS